MIAIQNVVVASDFGEASDAALRYGMELARRFDASLHVVHVVDDLGAHTSVASGIPLDLDSLQRTLEAEARQALDTLVPEPDRQALRAKLVVLTHRTPAPAILSYARDAEADLIILGTHGRHGLATFFLGSVAQQVSRAALCPVLTVRAHGREFLRPDALQVAGEAAATHAWQT